MEVVLPGGAVEAGRGQDLSFAGLSCALPHPLELELVVSLRLTLSLPAGGGGRVRARARVRHCRALRSEARWRVGFELLHLDPASGRVLHAFLSSAVHRPVPSRD